MDFIIEFQTPTRIVFQYWLEIRSGWFLFHEPDSPTEIKPAHERYFNHATWSMSQSLRPLSLATLDGVTQSARCYYE